MHAQSILERPRTTRTTTAAGALIVLCAVGAAGAAAVPGRNDRPDMSIVRFDWLYPSAFWPLALSLAAAGVWTIVRPSHARRAGVAAAILAAQLAGYGLVAVRDWFNAWGAGGMATHNLATVVTVAAGLAVLATVAACVGVGIAWREPERWRPARPRLVLAAAAIAGALPPIIAAAQHDLDITSLGQYALTYSIPWGAGLASAGWLDRPLSTVATGTVAGSAAITALLAYW
ncbi:hypothetical protein [Asanoa siamensis]|uniref:Uncharacterized protein n=1 Tax=Asanoa siamensis TaxID=926357 RepID=A0ABQ4CX75_9ACTN|nr:hypothetical protein [Asanoa siamensis]GIF75898.1 hypothetical protein Asi02nite_54160 [Asanoa siamensis]